MASSASRRPGSDFTLLFEHAAMSLVKEMPVLAVSRQLEISDKRLWRIVHHYGGRMLGELDLSSVATVGVDETASQRRQRYVTVFLDMQRQQEPVLFAVPGHGKAAIKAFSAFLVEHGGDPDNVIEVVCDMSQAFLSSVAKQLAALQELVADQGATGDAWVIKEKLRWIQKAATPRAARWRITNY
ncbi:transposase [Halomonas stenophila]|uniref:Transposase n=1 Tax=Halomonas stenophila TaxID=795312 RepID=A0A7W5HN28_9GAMM|nr:transposase [Halomonas stenophila]MBB3233116.1 transposase [Halomonas stenophila]